MIFLHLLSLVLFHCGTDSRPTCSWPYFRSLRGRSKLHLAPVAAAREAHANKIHASALSLAFAGETAERADSQIYGNIISLPATSSEHTRKSPYEDRPKPRGRKIYALGQTLQDNSGTRMSTQLYTAEISDAYKNKILRSRMNASGRRLEFPTGKSFQDMLGTRTTVSDLMYTRKPSVEDTRNTRENRLFAASTFLAFTNDAPVRAIHWTGINRMSPFIVRLVYTAGISAEDKETTHGSLVSALATRRKISIQDSNRIQTDRLSSPLASSPSSRILTVYNRHGTQINRRPLLDSNCAFAKDISADDRHGKQIATSDRSLAHTSEISAHAISGIRSNRHLTKRLTLADGRRTQGYKTSDPDNLGYANKISLSTYFLVNRNVNPVDVLNGDWPEKRIPEMTSSGKRNVCTMVCRQCSKLAPRRYSALCRMNACTATEARAQAFYFCLGVIRGDN